MEPLLQTPLSRWCVRLNPLLEEDFEAVAWMLPPKDNIRSATATSPKASLVSISRRCSYLLSPPSGTILISPQAARLPASPLGWE